MASAFFFFFYVSTVFCYRSSTILIIVVTISLFIFLRAIHLFLLLGVKRFLQFSGVLELRDFGF